MIGCDICGHLACVCDIKAAHKADCRYRIAATCAVGIHCDCELQRDVCPICDVCDCGLGTRSPFNPHEVL